VALLSAHDGEASLLAGGQSLVPMLNLRVVQPSVLVDINAIPDLEQIERRGDTLVIGARARHNDVLRSPLVRESAPLLAAALPFVAHEAIRNRGTLGGSLALADPSAELPACIVCLAAEIVAASTRGERRIPAAEFFQGIYTTALAPNELVTRIEIPMRSGDWRFAFEEVARRHGDFALAAVACAVRTEGDAVAACDIVFAGVEAAPRRIHVVEHALSGKSLTDAAARSDAKAALQQDLQPMEGGEYPSTYRVHLAGVLLDRALDRIASRP
jgi:carbon-monoxide dehydrogenase medium subunit